MSGRVQAHMNESQLFKALRSQNFDVLEEGEKITITSPEKQIHKFHRSSLQHSAYWAVVRDLEKLGFKSPDEVKRERKQERKTEERFICTGEAATRFGVTCGCGREFKHAMNLARHLAALAEREGKKEKTGKAADKEHREEHAAEITKPTPPSELMKLRALMRRLKSFAEDADQLAEALEPLIEENEELKRKLKKVEDLFGKALDVI